VSRYMTLHREIEQLKKMILQLGGLVENRLRRACQLLESRDPAECEAIIASDWEVDELEIRIEEECLRILALHQPVARDLRLIVVIIKINSELERIADFAVNISRRVLTVLKKSGGAPPVIFDFPAMGDRVQEMVKCGLDALVAEDADLARRLFVMDEEVNRMRTAAYRTVRAELAAHGNDSDRAACYLNLYLIAYHLERVGDRATNIAEEVIYLVEGEIIRNSGGEGEH
jgi:phosphate transport system protein